MHQLNLWAAWIGILLGMVTGVTQGLFFHQARWLGGYQSWPRRLMRLGHISFFGLAFVNLAFFLTVDGRTGPAPGAWPSGLAAASWLMVAGALFMPAVCYAAAWRPPWRRLFVLPVGCLLAAVVNLLVWGLGR